MDGWAWRQPVSNDEAARRAGGRRAYNSLRQLRAAARRQLLEKQFGITRQIATRGLRAKAARAFGVSEATISRDVKRANTEQLAVYSGFRSVEAYEHYRFHSWRCQGQEQCRCGYVTGCGRRRCV